MKGHITVCAGDSIRHFALNTTTTLIGSGRDCDLQGSSPQMQPLHCQIEWDIRSATWILIPSSAAAGERTRINGAKVLSPAYLQSGDILELPDMFIRFLRVPESPKFRGVETHEIRLQGLRQLTFGRDTGGDNDPGKVALDATDTSISRNHVVIERDAAGNWLANDESQAGTLLNGQHFKQQRLTVGDRFAIGAYHFEFTGYSIRRVERMSGGKIESRHLSVQVKSGKKILSDVSLDIERCSFVGILGGSGQGKSTLLTALCGINPATEGSVYLNGHRLSDPKDLAEAGIGYVPQDDIVHVEITVEQALQFSARLRLPAETPRTAIDTLVDETIERLGLTEHRKKRIFQLSGGQRKRVSIATELLAKPSVLFLDEPSSGLDPATEFQLMGLLRRLAAKDCTVVCTTHVLARAYLFDQITFVHGGLVVFHGEPSLALDYFDVENLDDVYLKLADPVKDASAWHRQFEEAHKGRSEAPDFGSQSGEVITRDGKSKRQPGSGYLIGLMVLLKRQWSILKADRLNLVFLLAQPLLIALLVGWVADDAVLRTFLCVVATLWFGCSNGAQQIVKELAIFRRERVCGLGMHCYVQSKYLFLGVVTTLQALLMYAITLLVAGWVHPIKIDEEAFRQSMAERLYPPLVHQDAQSAATSEFDVVTFDTVGESSGASEVDSSGGDLDATIAAEKQRAESPLVTWVTRVAKYFEIAHNVLEGTTPPDDSGRQSGLSTALSITQVFATTIGLKVLALVATALVGVAIGLAISALVQNSTQAVLWVPLVLIPQILFGGFVVTRPEMAPSVRVVSLAIPSHAAQRIMDVANLYGQTTPRMSNRTKYAVFLTPGGDQETVEWEQGGEKVSEKYDIVSEHNNSWQNLLVFSGHAGEHRHVYRIAKGKRTYDDSVEQRDDVRYPMGVLYVHLGPVVYGVTTLLCWLLACYLATWVGLARKQRGR
jgi:ABC-type multidrug transport system ATPase subunit